VPKLTVKHRLVPFVPFLVVGSLHLVGQLTHLAWLQTGTKPVILLSLAAALVWSVDGRMTRAAWVALVALLLGWVGDLALMFAGDTGFLVGLTFFLLGHLVYLLLFLRILGRGRLPLSALAYVVWFAVLMLVLAPHLGGMLVPVIVYASVITVMAITATRCSASVAVGAALFLISDSLLALNKFVHDAGIWESGFLVMLSYIAAQGLIVLGVVRHEGRPASGRVV
jgi:uncharacterized membrane protein YhhN